MTQDIDSLVLRPKRSSAVWRLLVCVTFVVGGVWLAQENGWMGYLCAGFFAIGIPLAVVQLLPGSTYLRIEDDGLSFANQFRVTKIPWSAVDRFFVVSIRHKGVTVLRMVGFNFVPSYDRARFGRRISSAISQCEGAMPGTYGKKAEELVDMLNACLQQRKRG